jgi:hypothetical protein
VDCGRSPCCAPLEIRGGYLAERDQAIPISGSVPIGHARIEVFARNGAGRIDEPEVPALPPIAGLKELIRLAYIRVGGCDEAPVGIVGREAFVLLPSELPVFLDPPRVIVDQQGMANTLQVRFIPLQPVASGFGRAPSAICRISGTAFVAPSL